MGYNISPARIVPPGGGGMQARTSAIQILYEIFVRNLFGVCAVCSKNSVSFVFLHSEMEWMLHLRIDLRNVCSLFVVSFTPSLHYIIVLFITELKFHLLFCITGGGGIIQARFSAIQIPYENFVPNLFGGFSNLYGYTSGIASAHCFS